MEWLLPVLLASKVCQGNRECIAKKLEIPSSTLKKLLFAGKRYGLISIDEKRNVVLTESGNEFAASFSIIRWIGRRLIVKGRDGCFQIMIRKRKGVKVIRVPCDTLA